MYSTIKTLLESIAADLEGINSDRYHYQVSPGIQEYMEAVLFQHYLEKETLMSYQDASDTLPAGIHLSHEDYLLGVFDMTGELMRFAITYMATNGQLPGEEGSDGANNSILTDMQDLRSQLEAIDTAGNYSLKEYESKMKVTRQSVEKVENGVYSMLVRGKERPKGWKPDTDLAGGGRGPEEIESY
jgi:predicted translin family RNA/ssDNA-binding protein